MTVRAERVDGGEKHPLPPLAKKLENGHEGIALDQHLRDVANYADQLWQALSPVVEELLGMEPAYTLRRALQVAALVHDVGKAAVGFQQQLLGRSRRWEFRHEVLSAAWLLSSLDWESSRECVVGVSEGHGADWPSWRFLAVAAVLTHHRACDDPQLSDDACHLTLPDAEAVTIAEQKFATRTAEMVPYWQWLHEFIRGHSCLAELKVAVSSTALRPPGPWLARLQQIVEDLDVVERKGLMLTLTRGWLMAADHAVSAGVTKLPVLLRASKVPPLRPFQQAAGEHQGDLLLEAPTGTGKTLAALQWVQRNRRRGERVFYLLPYQASIESMQGTLQRWFGKDRVGALHARALDYLFTQYFEGSGEYEVAAEAARREWELVRLVHKPLKVATPFQLIKWFFGVPRFEIGFSEMIGGLFVFDEIHAYDAHVAALILETVRVLKKLGGRFLFMSATFPDFLKELLIDALKCGDESEPGHLSFDSTAVDDWSVQFLNGARHRIRWVEKPLEAVCNRVVSEVYAGRRVLVVANRVSQAQCIYERVQKLLGSGVVLLHSRFTRRDRSEKERSIVTSLQGPPQNHPNYVDVRALIATQVVEVSLDISLDVLFTEVAPVDDLLQRMGRVNRYGERREPADVFICTEFDRERLKWVYDLERIDATLTHAPPDGEILTNAMARQWHHRVYQNGWTAKERQHFEQARQAFTSLLATLRPLRSTHTGEEAFHALFRGVEVLPQGLQETYLRHTTERQYLLADQLLVPVSFGLFHALRKKGRASPQRGGPPVVHVPYDPEYGLRPDGEELEGVAWFA